MLHCPLWAGDAVDRIRVGDGAAKLYGRRLSVHLMMQPIIGLKMLNDELLQGQGFLARCLISYPKSTIGTRDYSVFNPENNPAIVKYRKVIAGIFKMPFVTSEQDPQELAPRHLKLDSSAKKEWVKLHNQIEFSQARKGKLADIRPFASKAAEHAARLAGILALIENIDTGVIAVRHVQASGELIQYYINEALRLTTGATPDAQLIKAQKLGEWLADHHDDFENLRICLQQIYRESISLARSAKTARGLMKVLDEHEWVQRLPDETRVTYRRKQVGEVYRLADLDALKEVLDYV